MGEADKNVELKAMQTCVDALTPISESSRLRVLSCSMILSGLIPDDTLRWWLEEGLRHKRGR